MCLLTGPKLEGVPVAKVQLENFPEPACFLCLFHLFDDLDLGKFRFFSDSYKQFLLAWGQQLCCLPSQGQNLKAGMICPEPASRCPAQQNP